MAKREKFEEINEALRDTSFTADEVCKILAATNQRRSYYPELAPTLGLEVAVVLTQMEWRWANNGCQTFYKYISECDSCKKGDSWVGELGISRHKFDTALEKIGTRVRSARKAQELLKSGTELNHIVVYHLPKNGAMQWYFNYKLFLKLRAKLILITEGPNAEIQDTAVLQNSEDGHLPNSDILYSEQTHNSSPKEENSLTNILEDDSRWKNLVNSEAREKTKKKANSSRSKPPEGIIKDTRDGKVMSLDFSVSPSIMAKAIEKYKDKEWVEESASKFKAYYTNVSTKATSVDWSLRWLELWIADDWEKKQRLDKAYGKNRTTESASTKRVNRLKELAGESAVSRVGTTDLNELASRLRGRQ